MGIFAHESLGLYPIFKYGTDEQKKTYLVPGIAGEKIAGLAVTEPNAGSDVASMAKLYATEMVNRFTTNAIQIFGGYGYMMEYPVQRFYRDARVMAIGEGTSQNQRDIIAKRIGL